MQNVYTENMTDIMACSIERKEVLKIMQAWDKNGLPNDFGGDNVRFAYNRNSGQVFLTNDDYQVLMLNDGILEEFYTSPYDGHEGFIDELLQSYNDGLDSWHNEDIEWLNDIVDNLE